MNTTNLILITATVAIVGSGCYTRREIVREPAGAVPAREVVVVETPPAAQVETIGVAPSRDHVWIPGNWSREGDRWVWTGGRWEVRPNVTSVYVPGHWEKRGEGYVWREGYWK